MSDLRNITPRPVSIVTIFAVMGTFALFLLILYLAYLPKRTGVYTDDGLHTPEQRRANLSELRAKQTKQATSYAWVDQKTGVVQLPLDRAMELTVQRYGQAPANPTSTR